MAAKVLGPPTMIETITKGRNNLQIQAAQIIPQLEEGDELHYKITKIKTESIGKVTTATKMAIQARDPSKENTEETIPLQYQQYKWIFLDEEAKQFPPSRPWDHHIKL